MATELILPWERHDMYDFISPAAGLKDAAKGKTVLITGAGTGVGKATAQTFAAAGAARLILAARRAAPLEETRAVLARAYPACEVQLVPETDITQPASVRRLFESMARAGGGEDGEGKGEGEGWVPDVVINNAGRGGTMVDIDGGGEGEEGEAEEERWWFDFQVNVRGAYLVTRAYLRLLAGRPGRIVNTSSHASWRSIPGLSGYAMSKAALNRFSEYVDLENRDKGVRCFAMHPGGVAGTDLTSTQETPEWLLKMLIDTPELGAGTALYLSSGRADFLGGRYVASPWDMEKLEGLKERIEKEDLLTTRILGIA